MPREIFEKSIAIAKDKGVIITIGGGEPTLHSLFKSYLAHAVWELAGVSAELGMPAVHMVTNGSNTELALNLAKLAKRGIISCSVSHDQYHDSIEDIVIQAFKKESTYGSRGDDNDCRGINDEQRYIIPVGRAKGWGNHPKVKCACDAVFIKPDGRVYPCGCRKTCIGNIMNDSLDIKYEYFDGNCENSKEYKNVKKELELA